MKVSLLCLPCAGASASTYLRWQRSLPRWIQLVPVELPGRGSRMSDAFIDDFDELVEQLCASTQRFCDGPYALYGHSMGALVAYGMSIRRRSLSQRLPDAMFVSASPAPRARDPKYFVNKQSDAALASELRKQGGTPDEVFSSAEMLRIALDTLRADYRVCAGYTHRDTGPLAVPIHVFAGHQDDIEVERILAWEAETCSRFSVRWFDGGHFFIRQHEPALLRAITQHLSNEIARGANASAISA